MSKVAYNSTALNKNTAHVEAVKLHVSNRNFSFLEEP